MSPESWARDPAAIPWLGVLALVGLIMIVLDVLFGGVRIGVAVGGTSTSLALSYASLATAAWAGIAGVLLDVGIIGYLVQLGIMRRRAKHTAASNR